MIELFATCEINWLQPNYLPTMSQNKRIIFNVICASAHFSQRSEQMASVKQRRNGAQTV